MPFKNEIILPEKGRLVYDFALPMLVLHGLYSGTSERLADWLKTAPRTQFTSLDTPDGITIVDVRDLLTDEEIAETKNSLSANGVSVKKICSTAESGSPDMYRFNCTLHSALGNNDDAYVLARAIQFFAPGIPQINYAEAEQNLKRHVWKRLFELMKFRNTYPAFKGELFIVEKENPELLIITWTQGEAAAGLSANLRTYTFSVSYVDLEDGRVKLLGGI